MYISNSVELFIHQRILKKGIAQFSQKYLAAHVFNIDDKKGFL